MVQATRLPAAATARRVHIDTLRALACIALVSYHVVGANPAQGMELPADHWLAQLNQTFIDMRMPLFSFLSGCVFLSLERLMRRPAHVLQSKARRLLLPMVSVGLLFWLVRALIGQEQAPVLSLLILPYAHFWFLQATFLVMACFLLLYALLPVRSTTLAAGLLVAGACFWSFGPRPPVNLFSCIQAAYLMPFFMLGYLCAYGQILGRLRTVISPLAAFAILLLLIGTGYLLAAGHIQFAHGVERRVVSILIGLIFCSCLLLLAPRNALLAQLGGYSYTIYLFHVFFTAGMSDTLSIISQNIPAAVVWGAAVTAGLVGPILIHQILTRYDALAALFLGTRLPVRQNSAAAVAHSGAAQRA